MTGGVLLFRALKLELASDIFNLENETFPQEERHLEIKHSVNSLYCRPLKTLDEAQNVSLSVSDL
jgi:hypothetical protein